MQAGLDAGLDCKWCPASSRHSLPASAARKKTLGASGPSGPAAGPPYRLLVWLTSSSASRPISVASRIRRRTMGSMAWRDTWECAWEGGAGRGHKQREREHGRQERARERITRSGHERRSTLSSRSTAIPVWSGALLHTQFAHLVEGVARPEARALLVPDAALCPEQHVGVLLPREQAAGVGVVRAVRIAVLQAGPAVQHGAVHGVQPGGLLANHGLQAGP